MFSGIQLLYVRSIKYLGCGYYRGDAFLDGDLVPGRDGPGFLPDQDRCWDAAAVAATWKCRLTFTVIQARIDCSN